MISWVWNSQQLCAQCTQRFFVEATSGNYYSSTNTCIEQVPFIYIHHLSIHMISWAWNSQQLCAQCTQRFFVEATSGNYYSSTNTCIEQVPFIYIHHLSIHMISWAWNSQQLCAQCTLRLLWKLLLVTTTLVLTHVEQVPVMHILFIHMSNSDCVLSVLKYYCPASLE